MTYFPRYSVLMSVYSKENPSYMRDALESMMSQTVLPDEIVLVEDGALTKELYEEIEIFKKKHPKLLNIVSYDVNRGLGYALSRGLPECRNEIVARMDSDDYSFPKRMEVELTVLQDNCLDMVGSQIIEFIENMNVPVAKSNLPLTNDAIVSYSKKRNPFRHPSMVFKKTKALEAGNYSSNFLYFEDWDLFNRMLEIGCKANNIDETLVAMRVSPNFYERRGGISYLPYIWKFKVEQLRRGYFTFFQFISSIVPHVIVCLLPNNMRSYIYKHLLRKNGK